jgi:hypothetical protein
MMRQVMMVICMQCCVELGGSVRVISILQKRDWIS